MSEGTKAVFLSYASQDAEAAKRIADALRAAGVEVWFDQNELVGGDAWDQKIRRQIKDCALLIPIISANTQARTEGYFRLEWRLADQRTHLMAKGRPFLLPVVIDATRDAEAHVPDSFTEVQWTKLPGGEGGAAFAARVRRLLDPEIAAGGKERVVERPRADEARLASAGAPRKSRLGLWLGVAAVVIVALGLSIARPWERARTERAASRESPAVPVSEARKLANQAMQLLEDPNFTRETSWLADELCERALKLDAGDAEIWAVAALASVNLYWNTYDTSAIRREKVSSQSARAVQLDPKSVRAGLAAARSLDLNYETADSLRMLRELHRRAPEDQHVIFHLIRAEATQRNEAAVQELLRHLRALPRTGMLPLTLWFWELRLRVEGRFAEAEAIIDEMLAAPEQLRGAYYEKLNLLLGSWHDLAEVEPYIESIPPRYRQEPAFGSAIAQYWLWRRQPEKSLQALAQVPQDYFEEYAASEPKALLTGWAHSLAGRSAAAKAEWRDALALVEGRLRTDNRNFALLNHRAMLLALVGESGAAREAWQLRVELGGEQSPPNRFDEAKFFMALGDKERAISAIVAAWPKLGLGNKARAIPAIRHHPLAGGWIDDGRIQKILAEGAALMESTKAEQTAAARRPTKDAPAPALRVEEKSVAVLAFANLSSDKEQEYFSDGISEELLNVLAKVPGLKVSARTSAFHFKGKDTSIAEIAKQLGVAYVVEGSVRKSGDKVRITAQLIKAADGFHVWSDTFTRDLKDIFAVQDEIAGLIAKNLKMSMGLAPAAPRRAVNPEAHRLVLEGRHFLSQRTFEGLARAESAFNRAIQIDPEFAQAYAGLADVRWVTRVYSSYAGQNYVPGSAIAPAMKALELDPALAEAYPAAAAGLQWEGKMREADELFRKAISLNPNYALGHHWYSLFLESQGRLDLALLEIERAIELDPLSPAAHATRHRYLLMSGRIADALESNEKAQALRSGFFFSTGLQAQVLLASGRTGDALIAARSVVAHQGLEFRYANDVAVIFVLRQLGHESEAARHVENLMPRLPADSFMRGLLLASVDRWDEAIPYLERMPRGMCEIFYWNAAWDPWREDPRFLGLMEKLGCREDYKVARATLKRMQQESEAKK